MPTLSPWAPSSESALTKGFCAEVLGMLQIQLQSQLGLSHHPSSPKSTSSSGCREQQAVVFPGDEEEEPSSRSHGALLVLVTQQHWTPCGTWVVFQCSSMPFFANLKKNWSIICIWSRKDASRCSSVSMETWIHCLFQLECQDTSVFRSKHQ